MRNSKAEALLKLRGAWQSDVLYFVLAYSEMILESEGLSHFFLILGDSAEQSPTLKLLIELCPNNLPSSLGPPRPIFRICLLFLSPSSILSPSGVRSLQAKAGSGVLDAL